MGLGLLTKWTTVAFVGPPIVLVAAAALASERRLSVLWKAAVAGACGLLIAGPWYAAHWRLLADFFSYAEKGLLFAGDGPGWGQLAYYLKLFWATAGWPYTLLAIVGLLYLAWKRDLQHGALLLGVLAPLFTFSFLIATRDLRHLLPAFPFLLLGAAATLRSRSAPIWLRRGLTVTAAAFALVSAYHAAWGLGEGEAPLDLGTRSTLLLPESRPPDSREWGFGDLLQAVADDAGEAREPIVVRLIPGNLPFRANAFAFLAAERFPAMRIAQVPFYIPIDRQEHIHLGARQLLDGRYLLQREGDVNGNRTGLFHYARALDAYLARSPLAGELFPVVHTQRLPSGHRARVLRGGPSRCGAALADYLDWAHETDPDDPGIDGLVKQCAAGRGGFWRALAELLEPDDDGAARAAELGAFVAEYPQVLWGRRLLAAALRDSGDLAAAARTFDRLGTGSPYLCSPSLDAAECWLETGKSDDGATGARTGDRSDAGPPAGPPPARHVTRRTRRQQGGTDRGAQARPAAAPGGTRTARPHRPPPPAPPATRHSPPGSERRRGTTSRRG